MKNINRRSITNFLSYKEMKNVKAGHGDGFGPPHYSLCCAVYEGYCIRYECKLDKDCDILGTEAYCVPKQD